MRGAPAFEIEVGASRVWRVALAGVASITLVSLAAWASLWTQPRGGWVATVAVVAGLATAAIAASLWPRAGQRLRFDGSAWSIGDAGQMGAVEVAIDLGSFLLLRFAAASERRRRWLALEQGSGAGAAADWHALRCAVHAARPGRAASAAGAALAE